MGNNNKTKTWGGVSDPTQHDAKRFRYLVHAFNPFAKTNMAMINLTIAIDKQSRGENHVIDPAYGDQEINLYEQPTRVAERVSLSMSLIDQDHMGTWGDGGLILEVPEENIIANGPSDMGSINSDPSFLRSQFANAAISSGDELLAQTYPQSYNEVVAFANLDGSKIRLKGFFIKLTEDGEEKNKSVAQKMRNHAASLGLPIIHVVEPGPYSVDQIHDKDGKLAVHLSGKRYLLNGFDNDFIFRSFNPKGSTNFISPEEFDVVANHLEKNGYGGKFLANLLHNYEAANHGYTKAKVTFDSDGNVEEISQRVGYGRSEKDYIITQAGYGRIVDREKEIEKIQESMAGDGRSNFGQDYYNDPYRPMYLSTARTLVDEAAKYLSPDQKDALYKWFDKISPHLEAKSQSYYGRRNEGYGSRRFNLFG